jgi:hypothetical protein
VAVFVPSTLAYGQLTTVVNGVMLASMVPCLIDVSKLTRTGSNTESRKDAFSAMKAAFKAIRPVRCLVTTAELLFDLDTALPSIRMADIMGEENLEWERVLCFDPLTGAPGAGTNRTVEGFVSIGDLEWMGKGIEERGVHADSFRRRNSPAGKPDAVMTEEEARTMPALIEVSLTSTDETGVKVTTFTHLDLTKVADTLLGNLFASMKPPVKDGAAATQHLALFSSLSPSLIRSPSFPLLFLPPIAQTGSGQPALQTTCTWTWILIDDSLALDRGGDKRPYVTVIKSDGPEGDVRDFIARALASGVGRKILKGALL